MAFSDTITDVVEWLSALSPRNGDVNNGTNWRDQIQRMSNRDAFLHQRIVPPTLFLPLTLAKYQDAGAAPDSYWSFSGSYGTLTADGASDPPPTPATLYLPISLPKCLLSSVTVRIDGAVHSGNPSTKFAVDLLTQDYDEETWGTVSSVTDPATYGGSPDYDDVRDVVLTTNRVLLPSTAYTIKIASECGANALRGTIISGITLALQPYTSAP